MKYKQNINNRYKNNISCCISPSLNENNIKNPNNNNNYSQNLEKNSFISNSINSKEEISSVLSYFSHVKPSLKKNSKRKINIPINNKYNSLENKNKNKKYEISKKDINNIEKDNKIIKNKENKENKENNIYIKKEINNKENIQNYNQNNILENIIKLINDNISKNKDIKQKIKLNNKLIKQYLLNKEIYNTELKKKNLLINKDNIKQIKYKIHVDINSKINEKLYLNMKKIKNEELLILEKIFEQNKINKMK